MSLGVFYICWVPGGWNSQNRPYLGVQKPVISHLSNSSGFALLVTQKPWNPSLSLHSNPGGWCVVLLGDTWTNWLFPGFQALPALMQICPGDEALWATALMPVMV